MVAVFFNHSCLILARPFYLVVHIFKNTVIITININHYSILTCWLNIIKLFFGSKYLQANIGLGLGPELGNCDIYTLWKILFINKMKRCKICPRPKGWVKKIFQTLPPNLLKDFRNVGLNFVYFAWTKVR